ncbi:MAG: SH3 domain-containing protein [Lachnospiraceae bacterium]|nr:SH3 domain-containing protein [Lachnospiraceae bacterium]
MKKRIGMLGILLCMGIATSTAYAGSWSLVENEWYYLNEQGEKQTGWIKDQGNYYYLDVHGVMQTGWVEFSGSWYYFADDGSMVSGEQTIRGIDYSFSEHGWLIEGPGMDMEYSASMAPNMTWQMCTADYWIDRMNKPNEVLLTEDEIQDLNQKILKQSGTNMYDLSKIAPTFNGVKMAANNANFKSPTGLYLDGKAVPEEYYEAIRNNIRNANVTEKMEIKYAFSVNRTEMKAYPYEEFLSDSKTDVEWDNLVSAAIRVNEPLVVYFFTADGKYALAKNSVCSGWVPTKDIAICANKAEWEEAQKMEQFLVVTGEKIYLEAGTAYPDVSEKCLPMGTVLELVSEKDTLLMNRMSWNNYVVKMPHRNEDGSFSQKKVLIPVNRDVNVGYLKMTRAEIVRQAFKCLGNRYGWGGMLNSQDCSGYIRDVYRCFGLDIPRNTTWQAAMPVQVTNLGAMTDTEKKQVLNRMEPGTILQFPGHEMLYLGEVDGRYYTINDISSMVSPVEGETGDEVLRIRSVIVNDLTTRRKNGKQWLQQLSNGILIWK